MGAVKVKTEMIGLDRGYPVTTATRYIYCDACGSFDIRTYISFSKVIPLAVVLAGGTWLIRQNIQWIVCILPLALVCLVLFMPWKFPDYQCRKCGNTKISHENSWKYPTHDKSILDVPEDRIQKDAIDTTFDEYDEQP